MVHQGEAWDVDLCDSAAIEGLHLRGGHDLHDVKRDE